MDLFNTMEEDTVTRTEEHMELDTEFEEMLNSNDQMTSFLNPTATAEETHCFEPCRTRRPGLSTPYQTLETDPLKSTLQLLPCFSTICSNAR